MPGLGAALLRQPLLAAGRSQRLRHVAERSRVARPLVERYVAGAGEPDALRVSRQLVAEELLVSLDFLGENTTSPAQAGHTVTAYRSVLKALGRTGLAAGVEVSLKLSAIGQSLPGIGDSMALEGARQICAAAAEVGTTVTVDMEDHSTTDSTLMVLAQLRADFPWAGAVLQAHLKRTESDCKELATAGSRVRLCKGAYAEPESVAFRGKEVSASYRRCLQVLMAGAGYPMVATHDPEMITAAAEIASSNGRGDESFEYQMLFGVRPDAQRALAAAGRRMRVYVPYGDEWYGYFMRRLAERPANVGLFLRSLSSRK